MTSAKINGIDVHYQAFGEGETIVFAHGAGGNLLSWWQQIPYFSQNYRCITIDQRGFGHSLDVPNGPGSGAFVEDLVGLLDYLEIDSPTWLPSTWAAAPCLASPWPIHIGPRVW